MIFCIHRGQLMNLSDVEMQFDIYTVFSYIVAFMVYEFSLRYAYKLLFFL
jgi:hypothetical protein